MMIDLSNYSCPNCGGSGHVVDDEGVFICNVCNGSGTR